MKWFILINEKTHGPFNTQETEELLQKAQSPALVWWRGQIEWITPEAWFDVREEVEAEALKNKEKTWKIRTDGGDEHGPFSEEGLIDHLKSIPDLSKIEVWTKGMLNWEDIYNIHQFMDILGVCRRKHPRVSVDAKVHLSAEDFDLIASSLTISEGGFGVDNARGLEIGQKVNVILKSRNISIPIRATAIVVYVSMDNCAGLKFDHIMPECQAAIIEYVKRETEEIFTRQAA